MAEEGKGIEGQIPFTQAPDAGAAGEAEPWGERTRVVGQRRPRVDGYERVSGAAVFPSDVVLPGMVYGAMLGSPHANARVKSIDTAAAAAMPGVYAVISRNTGDANPAWSYGDGHQGRLFEDHCRFEGEAVAAVAADSPYRAADALRAIAVEYEELPFVSDVARALDDDAPGVHPDGNLAGESDDARGDVEQGFAAADVVLERSYRVESQMQTPLEPHGCVARWDGDRLTVWESTQGVFAIQGELAEVLGLPLARVRVIGHYVGGAFGSKLRTDKYAVAAALMAQRINRPVKLFLTREQTLLTQGNRPPTLMTLRVGAKKDGTLTAIHFEGTGASGAYRAGGTALLDWIAKDLYRCPNVRTHLKDVYINAQPARPFRAPGYVQCSWAMDQMMDELATELAMDPVALRLKNIPGGSQARGDKPYTTDGLRRCIEEGAAAFGWQQAKASGNGEGHVRRGVGMAAANWFVGDGGPPATVILRLYVDGTANLNMGASDIGTGTKTVMAMVVAEEFGMGPDAIQVEHADTATTQFATPSGGSKTVPTEAPTVRRACLAVKDQLMDMAAAQLGRSREEIRFAGDRLETTDGLEAVAITDLDALKNQKVVVGVGERRPNRDDVSITPFAAQFCEVEVNTRTGEVRLLRMLGTNESGRVINRLTWDGQVVGGITMGVGFAQTESRVLDGPTGKLCNKSWHDYKLPTALDVPDEVVSAPVMLNDREANIVGAKGLGEPVTIPTGAAIANAVYDAVGVRMSDTPINPETLVARIHHQEGQP
ncbi:MAG: xanthine dehydrogenase family protein molybdopterin-binding subunit [Gammaproteobacteria bacterium]|nr:xanthine dehydrogenase family protein molybdopterin-binding subunit [Gammaproteobacteria bacterium]